MRKWRLVLVLFVSLLSTMIVYILWGYQVLKTPYTLQERTECRAVVEAVKKVGKEIKGPEFLAINCCLGNKSACWGLESLVWDDAAISSSTKLLDPVSVYRYKLKHQDTESCYKGMPGFCMGMLALLYYYGGPEERARERAKSAK